jgi:hypothetical protein
MRQLAVLFLAVSMVASGMAFVASSSAQAPGQRNVNPEAIKLLVANLSHESFALRESATKQLQDIGLPALEQLQQAEEKGDPETQARAAPLVKAIRAANRLPTRSNGLQFALKVVPKRVDPEAERRLAILHFEIEITNVYDKPCRLNVCPGIHAKLATAEGVPLPFSEDHTAQLLRDAAGLSVRDPRTSVLKRDDSYVLRGDVTLWKQLGPTYLLRGTFIRASNPRPTYALEPSTYLFSLVFFNREIHPDTSARTWIGYAETLVERISID